jgi:predicted AlkP superfamily pyrophosphatase or phosphodiesterase
MKQFKVAVFIKIKVLFLCLIFGVKTIGFSQEASPKLVVGIVVDQMSYDYLYRFYPHFEKNGFRRLMDKGTNFRNVNYNYVPTYTGPGHASIYTGTTPSNHGIVANDWLDRQAGEEVNCVGDKSVSTVGSPSEYGKCSPHFLRANTITDQLKLTYPSSKVIGASIKDRGAILPAGHLSDGSYWYDYSNGNFITSTYFKTELPAWVTDFNAKKGVLEYIKTPWNLLKDSSCYQYRNQDDSKYEVVVGNKTSPTFPYDFNQADLKHKFDYFTTLPAANTLLTDFALSALQHEQLGKHATTDFLTVSYSTPDIAGHAFGPYSLEMEDMYFRLDLEIARLLNDLDRTVGKGKYVVFLTADHACVPVPQYLIDHKLPGGYLFLNQYELDLSELCALRFGKDYLDRIDNNNVYLTPIEPEKREEVLNFYKTQIASWNGVKAVFTDTELATQTKDKIQSMTTLGYDATRSGELVFVLQPGYLLKKKDTDKARKGTSHGSAFNYDTHVPVLFYGKNIPKQQIFTPYEIIDIVPTLTHILRVQLPNATTGKPMVEVLK